MQIEEIVAAITRGDIVCWNESHFRLVETSSGCLSVVDIRDSSINHEVKFGPDFRGGEYFLLATPESRLLAAAEGIFDWMEKSNLTHTPPAGVGVFRTEPHEYQVVTELREAIKEFRGKQ